MECVSDGELEEQYLKISDLISEIDKKIVSTKDHGEILSLIEQRKPLSVQLIEIFGKLKEKDRQEIETITKLASHVGGITMKGKDIKSHKNGVKISVSKAYLDDKLLDIKKKYTVILLPE